MTRIHFRTLPQQVPNESSKRVTPKLRFSSMMLLLLAVTVGGCSGDGSTGNPAGENIPGDVNDPGGVNTDPVLNDPDSVTDPVRVDLPPLPDPALTQAPSSDDEPLLEADIYNTATGIPVLQEPGPRLPETDSPALTDADFEAGPLPPQYQIPASVDPDVNSAPYFDNLGDHDVFAGEILEVLFKPLDSDGGLPGMYPEELPEGAVFRDNLNGTKTLVWQPLQRDVGIREFTVVALDPLNSEYRTARTIRIRIELPQDLSTIPNVPPRLEELESYTIRVNDPVVLEIKGIDLNGPYPILEIPELPAGATFNQHLRYEEVYVLKFTPVTVGTLPIEVIARDAVDPSLTATQTVELVIRDAADFVFTGQRLRDLASSRGINIGFASRYEFYHRPDSGLYTDIAAKEFDIVTPENALKMDYINPQPGRYQFAETDNVVAFANANNMRVHGHPLVWHRQLPEWIERSSENTRQGHMQEYVHRILSRYKDSIDIWDVVNEPLSDDGSLRDSVWYQAMGEDYIDIAFHQAKATAPNSIRLLNDYDVAWRGAKSTAFFELVERLQQREVPIDGVGFQLHIWSDFERFDEVHESFQRVADLGLDVYVTELDVSLSSEGDVQRQAEVYRDILRLCLDQPRCKAFQMWGFTDQYSWRRNHAPLILDTAYQAKPAYTALQNELALP